MNLHDARFKLGEVFLWLEVSGRRGSSIGNHLWEVTEGTPPPLEPMPSWNTRTYWTPRRYNWRPFATAISTLFHQGYIPPLCGKMSRSHAPRASTAEYTAQCERCTTLAAQQGIIAHTGGEILLLSDLWTRLGEERAAWQRAGRPDTWP